MRLPQTGIALGLIAALSTCTSVQTERSDARPEHEPASARVADPIAIVARTDSDELGAVVQELSDSLWIVFQDSANRYWFGSDGQGAYRVDGKSIVRYTTQDGLCNDHIRQILEDGSGNLFFSTTGGISKFDGRRFSTLVPVESGTSADEWKSAPGDLWFTGKQEDHGPYRYDGESLHRLEFPKIALEDVFNSRFFDCRLPGAPFSPYSIYTIHRDRRGALWFGTSTFGVCRYDGSSFTWITEDELTELDDGPSFGVRGIIEDKEGKFWFSNLLHRYDGYPNGATENAPAAPKYEKERGIVDSGEKGQVVHAYFMSGLTDRRGVSWVATLYGGVGRYDGKQLTHVPVVAGGRPIALYSIYEDNGGVLWLGTQATGAWRFNGQTFERFRP